MKQHWNAEQIDHDQADGWAIVYDPTPGGRVKEDGSTVYSLRFPVLLLTDYVGEPDGAAKDIAALLNQAENLKRERNAA